MVWLDLTINRRRRPQFKVNYGVRAIDPTQKQVLRRAEEEKELHSIIGWVICLFLILAAPLTAFLS
jgi:hypothetical protein